MGALAEAAKERAKLAQENERQHKTMAEQLQEHMKENAVLSATAAAELAKLRQETNKNTTKYKAEEARLLADLEEMKRAESALRDSYKKQLEKEQKMHQKTKEERKKLNDTLAKGLKKEKKLKIDLANELEKGSQLKTALATVQNDLSTTEAERNKKIEELVQTKQKHEAVTFALMADVAAATNERKETERRLNAELDAQKAANIEIHQEAQRKQAVLDKMIDSEKQRAIEHAKTMAQLDTLEGYSKEEKATLLAAARKDLDTSNQALHNLEQKLLNELAKERAAANKNKAESNTVKKQCDATEKARRQIAGQFDEASRQNNDLAMQLEKMANDKKKVLADLLVEKEKEKKLIDDLKKHEINEDDLERQLEELRNALRAKNMDASAEELELQQLAAAKKAANAKKRKAMEKQLNASRKEVQRIEKELSDKLAALQKTNDALQIEKSEVEERLAALQASHAQMLQDIQAQTKAQADAETQRMKDAKKEKDSLRNETKQEHDRAEEEKAHAERLEQRLAELEQKLKEHEENEKNNTSNALVLGLVEKHEETLGSMKEEVAPAKVQQRRKSVQIQMTHVLELDTINFKVNTVTIVDESKNCVDTIAKILVDNPTIKVRVEGHVDGSMLKGTKD